jgi:hypothetical protein
MLACLTVKPMDKKELMKLLGERDAPLHLRVILGHIASYKEKLASMPQHKLTDAQKMWSLACEAVEAKIATGSKESIWQNISLLDGAIEK